MDYDRIRATAARLLAGAKQGAVVLTRTTRVGGTTTEPLAAVVKGVSAQFVDNTTVRTSDLEVLCTPPQIRPEPGDTAIIDGRNAKVLVVTPIPAAGEPAVWRLIVKG